MNWDEKADEGAIKYYSDWCPKGTLTTHRRGAKWQRDQLRTDEAIERVAVALFGEEAELDWEYAAQWVRDDYALFARRAIDALLGEDE